MPQSDYPMRSLIELRLWADRTAAVPDKAVIDFACTKGCFLADEFSEQLPNYI
ncbi:MAG: hypothetical protein ACI82I_003100 [Gammaproteobacteria bacterium]|jgi:hypothetical protein